jgi:Lrp/AsnC family transcriptional regulator, regulator for asnA, asnC and gidA
VLEERKNVAQDTKTAEASVGKLADDALAEALGRKPGSLDSPEDSLNRAIIRMLQEDGRLPFQTIAAALNVSEGTIRNRFNRMKEAGHLRVVALADPIAINYRADAMLGIKVAASSTPEQVAKRLSGHPAAVYVLWVSGRYDLLVEVVFDSRQAFLKFLQDHCYGQEDIAEIEVMTGLEMYKNQFLLKRDFDVDNGQSE